MTGPTGVAPADSPVVAQAPDRRIPILAILGVTVFARGLLIPWLGFYWDDLPTLWAMHLSGPLAMWEFYQSARPFLPWIYMLTAPIAGESPLAWQIIGLASWFLAATSVWWLLRSLWPARPRLALLAALLFVVYPGFLQGPISLIYSHFLFLSALFFFSLSCSVHAIRGASRSTRWSAAALAAQALALFSFEYLVGLELARPFVIAVALRQAGLRGQLWLRRCIRIWLPHLGVLTAYLVWRAVTPRFPAYEPALLNMFTEQPAAALQVLVGRILSDVLLSTGGAWLAAAQPPVLSIVGRAGLAVMAAAFAGTALISLWALRAIHPRSGAGSSTQRRRDLLQALALGAWATLIAGVAAWVPLLPIKLSFPWDRMTLPFMLGSSILLAALLVASIGRWRFSLAVFAAVVALGAAHQAANAMSFVRDWRDMNSFLAQLTSRAPGIEPGTVLLTNDIPLKYFSDNSLTAPLNWTYKPDLDSKEVPYMLYYISVRLGLGLPALEPNLPIYQWYRAGTFEGSTSDALALYFNPPGCLQVLDVRLHDSMPGLPSDLSKAVPLSDLSLIDPAPQVPAKSPFSREAEPNWCIQFERADLARQQEDWSEVARIGDQALSGPDRPNDASEYIPFIQGYGHVGRWGDALHWTKVAMERNSAVRRMICNTWKRMEGATSESPEKTEALTEVLSLARCEP